MPQLRTGFTCNGNALPDRERLVAWVASARPTTMTVMDGHELAVSFDIVSESYTKVNHRQYNPGEGGEWRYTPADVYVADLIKWGHPEIYRQVLNEPAITTDELPALITWLVQVMDLLYDAGYHGVIGNFPMGQITQAQVESGLFDPLLIKVAEKKRLDGSPYHYIGIHEYTAVARYFGVGQWPYWAPSPVDYFLSPANHEPVKWPIKEDLPVSRINGELPPYWHVRRADWLTIRAREIGLPEDPQYWVTESGYDSMPDVGAVYPALTDKWGIAPGYDNLRGFNSLANVWAAYWGNDWNFDEAAFEQEKWLHEECYPSNYVGWNNFMWTSDHWRRDGFDMSQNLQFQSLLVDYAAELRSEQPPGSDPNPTPEPPPDELPAGNPLLALVLLLITVITTAAMAVWIGTTRTFDFISQGASIVKPTQWEILKSKRFWTAIVGVIMMALVAAIPSLESYTETLEPAIVILFGVLIGGYSIEETAQAWRK